MKTNLDSMFKTDERAEKEGRMFEIDAKVGFLLKPFKNTNPSVKAAVAAHYKPYARQIDLGTLDEKKALELNVKVFVQACLVDWKGVEIDGKPAVCKPEVAVPFFIALPDLFNTLWAHCQDFKNYREDVGNS